FLTLLGLPLPTEALALDLAPADIPLLHAFIAQRPTLSVR
ncbi:hypothetical protein ACLBSN_30785, partial [Klebsiella pneumoniae]